MKSAHLIFPHQLFKDHPLIEADADCWLIELSLFFTQYPFHQQKIAFHRASMQAFAETNATRVNRLTYIEAHDSCAEVSELIRQLAADGYQGIHTIDSTDDWLESQLSQACDEQGLERNTLHTLPCSSTPQKSYRDFFGPTKTTSSITSFTSNKGGVCMF